MASKDVKFTIVAKANGWNKLGEIMEQNEQRDCVEEAANRALMREEELEATPEQLGDPIEWTVATFATVESGNLRVTYVPYPDNYDLNEIAVHDDLNELEFGIHPSQWPALKDMLEAEYQKWLNK